jgi:hypothetical protein
MKAVWYIECIKGTLKLVEYVTYSSGKQVKRVYSDPKDLTNFEIVG